MEIGDFRNSLPISRDLGRGIEDEDPGTISAMNFEQVAMAVARSLQASNIPYMLTGALAVNYHGKPRMTHDVDVVVSIAVSDIQRIKQLFDEDFFVDDHAMRTALDEAGMFNIIHKETGLKVDFWMLKNDEYSHESFGRRKWYPYQGLRICLATPEDMVINKLEWFKMSDIDKHYDDALGIYRIQREELDLDYVSRWCQKKSISEYWEKILKAG
jgi:hypothetical protein